MKLTPLDIRHKEFKRGMRGYADVEVDEFLDQIADEYERLFKENIDLQDRVEALEEKVAGYKRIEETLQKTLVNAQASAEEQKQNANKQSQLILQDAELKSRQMVNEAYSERQAIEQSMAKLKSAEEDFRFKFRQLLDGYLRLLQDQPEVKVDGRPAGSGLLAARRGHQGSDRARVRAGASSRRRRRRPRAPRSRAGTAGAAAPEPSAETPAGSPCPRRPRSRRRAGAAASRRACTPSRRPRPPRARPLQRRRRTP